MVLILDISIIDAAIAREIDLPSFLLFHDDQEATICANAAATLLERGLAPTDTIAGDGDWGRFADELLAWLPVAAFGLAEARRLAELRAELAVHGLSLERPELEIASTVLALDGSLATTTPERFSAVDGLKLLDPAPFRLA